MTPMYGKQIEHPMAWKGSELRKEDISYALSAAQGAALKDILLKVADVPREQITLEQCSHAALDASFANLLDEIMLGRGLVCFQGIPTNGHSIEDIEKMYWAIGTHLGTAL